MAAQKLVAAKHAEKWFTKLPLTARESPCGKCLERFNSLKRDPDAGKGDVRFSCECETTVGQTEETYRLRHWNDLGDLFLVRGNIRPKYIKTYCF